MVEGKGGIRKAEAGHRRTGRRLSSTTWAILRTPSGLGREVLMGVGDRVASVIMLTFTKRPGPHADTAWAVIG